MPIPLSFWTKWRDSVLVLNDITKKMMKKIECNKYKMFSMINRVLKDGINIGGNFIKKSALALLFGMFLRFQEEKGRVRSF